MTDGSDIQLLFGVKGGVSMSKDSSGGLIQEQLTEIIKNINENPLKIKVDLDTSNSVKKSWEKQLQSMLGEISKNGKLSVQVPVLNLTANAVKEFKKQISSIAEIKVATNGVSEANSKLKETTTSISAFNEEVGRTGRSGTASLRQLRDTVVQMQKLLNQNPQMRGTDAFASVRKYIEDFSSVINECSEDTSRLGEALRNVGLTGSTAIENARNAMSEFKADLVNAEAVFGSTSAFHNAKDAITKYYSLLSDVSKKGDVVFTEDGWKSASGNWSNLAKDINDAAKSLEILTDRNARAKMSESELSELDKLLEQKERDLARAVEDRANAQRDAAAASEKQSSDFQVQLQALKATISSVGTLFNSAISGASRLKDSAHIEEITTEYKKFKAVADEALNASNEKGVGTDDLAQKVALLREMSDGFQSLLADKRRLEKPTTESDVQFRVMEKTIASINSLFDDAVIKASKLKDSAHIEEITTEYEKFSRAAEEALNSSENKSIDSLKENVALVQNAADEFGEIVSLARQLEMPDTDYAVKLREANTIIRSIKREFDSIILKNKDANFLVSDEDVDTARSLLKQIEEIDRRLSSAAASEDIQKELPAIESILAQIKNLDDAIKQTKERLDELSSKRDPIGAALGKLSTSTGNGSGQGETERAKIEEISAQYKQWADKIAEVKKAIAEKSPVALAELQEIEDEGKAIQSNIDLLNEERIARENAANAEKSEKADRDKKDREYESSQARLNSLRKAGIDLLGRMEQAERKWTAAKNGASKENYLKIKADIESLRGSLAELGKEGVVSADKIDEFDKELKKIRISFSDNSKEIKGNNEAMGTLSARMGNLAQKFSAWFSVSQIVMLGVRSVKKMVTSVIELDDAMTQLKIVTHDTSKAYDEYLGKISQTATKIGSAIPDLIDSTTTFARLGYSLEESSSLAEFTAMLQNVGNIDVSDAQDAITAIVKAFDINVDEIESIMDKLVITGNNFPISVSQIAEGMNNASSALAAAGNTFEQSVALLTAANTTIQNASKSSTGLRTIAARLRSTTTELEELGESMTEEQYGDLVAALTKYNVALTDTNGEFRSTYDIVADIAAIWEDLSTMEQAALANAIAGVRQQSVFFSMVEQFREASGAMEDMSNSAGTLQSSYATFMESTTAHINQFKAAFQSLAQTTLDPESINRLIDLGVGALRVLETIMKLVNVIGGLNTVLSTTAGIMVTINSKGIADSLAKLTDPIKKTIDAFNAARMAGDNFGKSISAAFGAATAGATGFQLALGAIGIALAAIPIVINIFDTFVYTAEKARNKADELYDNFAKTTNEITSINTELETSYKRIKELKTLSDDGVATLVEKDELANLRREVQLLERRKKILDEQAKNDAKEADRNLVDAFNMDTFVYSYTGGAASAYYLEHEEEILAYRNALSGLTSEWNNLTDAEQNAARTASETYDSLLPNERYNVSVGWNEHVQELIQNYNALKNVDVSKLSDDRIKSYDDALEEARKQLVDAYSELQQNYIDKIQFDDDAKAQFEQLADMMYFALHPAEYISDLLDSFPEQLKSALDMGGRAGALTEDSINELVGAYSELEDWMSRFNVTAADVASHFNSLSVAQKDGANFSETYTAKLKNLTDVISDTKSSYEALKAAQDDMASGGGLSTDTIEKLAKAEGNYLDCLYEENGVIKLNTEAWKKNADAKMHGEIAEIQKEIDSLEAQRDALHRNIDLYNNMADNADDISEMYYYLRLAREETGKLDDNAAAIAEKQGKLALYENIFHSIAADIVSIETVLSKFDTVSGHIDKLSGALGEFKEDGVAGISTLAGLSDAFGDLPSFEAFVGIMSDSASSMDDAQQACNQLAGEFVTMSGVLDTVNESNAEIVTRMLEMIGVTNANDVVQARLKVVYLDEQAAAMGLADAVWEDVEAKLSEAGASGSLLSSLKQLREERYNAKLAALDAAEASESAISALIGEAKAAGVAAEQLAQLEKVKFFVKRFEQAKSDPNIVISEEAEKNYYAAIDRMLDRAKADLSDIGNFLLPEIKVSVPENTSKNSPKKIEEYIADIDKYREAVERLRKAMENVGDLETEIDNTGSLEKRIELQKELIAAYQEEQAALHNLNDQRDATIIKESQSLRKLGFDVQYDADANELWISNLEHLNELTADSKGKYDSVQEATNALRKDTEELINTLESLNEANRENSKSWTELTYAIREANIAIYENTLKERENLITLTENWLEMATGDNDIKRIEQHSDDIVSYYRDMQDTLHQEAEYYRSLGYSDTSDEVSKLSDLWWDYENNIKDVKQNVVNYLADIVASASGMVDDIQNVFDTLKGAADEYAQNGGFISIDTFQKIIDLGPQYMQYLRDENGLLVINEERIQGVIAARAEQLALENAMTYVERLKLALQEDSIEDLNELLYATEKTTGATWDLVEANLAMLGLDDDGYKAALHNIEALKAIALGAIDGLGKTAGAAQGGFDSILNYVMDMLKRQTQDEIDALNDMKQAYGEIIDQRKAALDAAKKEADYEKDKASKLKEIAKVQAKIDALSLDSSREAQAERIKLEEEKAQLQESLADTQSNYAIESQKNALDEMKDAYDDEKDDEIKKLEDSISSQQKLYEKAADYITYYWQNSWDDLRTQLLQWNYDVGNSLQTEIETAWDNCTAYINSHPLGVSGLFQSGSSSGSSSGGGSNKSSNNTVVAATNGRRVNDLVTLMKANSASWNTASSDRQAQLHAKNQEYAAQIGKLLKQELKIGEDGWWYLPDGSKLYDLYGSNNAEEQVNALVTQMKANSAEWNTASNSRREALEAENRNYAAQIEHLLGKKLTIGEDGWWYLPNKKKLYEVYGGTYHTGGFAGEIGSLKDNEVMAKLEKGEPVLTARMWDSVTAMVERFSKLSKSIVDISLSISQRVLPSHTIADRSAITNVTNDNSRPVEINFGSTIINGANEDTVAKHRAITRQQTNELLDKLNIRH